MSKQQRTFGLVILAVLLIAAYLGYQLHERKRHADDLRQETLANALPTVSVVYADNEQPTETITLPGTVDAWYQAPIYAQVSGYVKMWYKDYGALVKQGDVLAEINTPMLDAQYEQAKADMESQRAKYQLAVVTARRYESMRDSHAVSEQSITVQDAHRNAEEAQLKAAEQNVNNFAAMIKLKTIVAPYDGVVTVRNINVGDFVNKEGNLSNKSGITNLFSVADIHQMRLFISVPGTFAHILKPGLTADVTVPQFLNRHFNAKFLTVAKGFDLTTRTIITEFTIDNADRSLWPGSYATVLLTAPTDPNIMVVPASALVFQENGTQLAVLTPDDRIHFTPITLGRILDRTIEVTEGISKTDRIVNNPSAALLEGDKVRVVTPAPGYQLLPQKSAKAKPAPSPNALPAGDRQ